MGESNELLQVEIMMYMYLIIKTEVDNDNELTAGMKIGEKNEEE